jgi:uncharacterized protein YeaO (DUF488 family)
MTLAGERIRVKRIYEKPARADGTRVLVDRLWPRGISKSEAQLHAWLRDLAPSDTLRQWFHAQAAGWPAFRRQYLKELSRPEAADALNDLYRLAQQRKRLTLLFSSKNEEHNNAVVLKDLLDGMRKPPTGTGPGAVRALRERQAKRMVR